MEKILATIFNGRSITNPRQIRIPYYSQTVQWGQGVFTTMRTYNGKVFRFEDHIKRLFSNANFVGLKSKTKPTEIRKLIENTVSRLGSNNDYKIKINIFGEGTLIHFYEFKIDPKIYEGVLCKSVNSVRAYPEIKKTSYLDSIIPHNQATKEGCFEAILIDQKGYVSEGAFSNIFWFEDDILCTRNDNILLGITRKNVLETSPFKTKFKKITIEKLKEKKEVFLTQTTNGIVPVLEVDENTISKEAGERTKALIECLTNRAVKK